MRPEEALEEPFADTHGLLRFQSARHYILAVVIYEQYKVLFAILRRRHAFKIDGDEIEYARPKCNMSHWWDYLKAPRVYAVAHVALANVVHSTRSRIGGPVKSFKVIQHSIPRIMPWAMANLQNLLQFAVRLDNRHPLTATNLLFQDPVGNSVLFCAVSGAGRAA